MGIQIVIKSMEEALNFLYAGLSLKAMFSNKAELEAEIEKLISDTKIINEEDKEFLRKSGKEKIKQYL